MKLQAHPTLLTRVLDFNWKSRSLKLTLSTLQKCGLLPRSGIQMFLLSLELSVLTFWRYLECCIYAAWFNFLISHCLISCLSTSGQLQWLCGQSCFLCRPSSLLQNLMILKMQLLPDSAKKNLRYFTQQLNTGLMLMQEVCVIQIFKCEDWSGPLILILPKT